MEVDSVKGSTFVVMDKNSAQAKLYGKRSLLRLAF